VVTTKLVHPQNDKVYARVGFDHAFGFFVEVYEMGARALTFDAQGQNYDRERSLWRALLFLTQHGFYTRLQLEDALTYLAIGGRRPRSKGAALALLAVTSMKAAADLDPGFP
jgi:hypothetical protein